jgi:hypothetical protein
VSVPAPASTAEAVAMVLTGLRHLAATDPTALAVRAQAECLQAFEQAGAISTVARAWYLGRSPRPRATARTRITARRRG